MSTFYLTLNSNGVDIEQASKIIYKEKIQEIFGLLKGNGHYHELCGPDIQKIERGSEKIVTDDLYGISLGALSDQVKSYISEIVGPPHFSEFSRYVHHVLFELLTNALKNAESKVDLELRRDESSYRFVIQNDGESIDFNRVRERLKKSFTDVGLESKKEGAGLGLAMVLNLVDQLEIVKTKKSGTRVVASMKKYKRLYDFKLKKTRLLLREEE